MNKRKRESSSALISISEAAGMLNCHPNTLRHWDKDGTFKAIRIGKKVRRYRREDISDLLKSNQVQKSQHYLSDQEFPIASRSHDIVVLFDNNGNCKYINKAGLKLSGYSKDEIFEKNVLENIHPDDKKKIQDWKNTENLKARISNKSGKWLWIEISSYPMTWKGTSYICVLAKDITEEKTLMEKLQKSEDEAKNLIKFAPVGIYEVDFRTQKLISVNDAMCILTGYTEKELLNMNTSDLLDDKGKAMFRERVNKWLKGEKSDKNVEYTVIAKDGHKIYAELHVTFKSDEDGNPIGATVIGYDITERKKAEEKIYKSNTKINEILTSIKDDFYVLDRNWNFVYANKQFADKMGKQPEDFIGRNIWNMFPKHKNTILEDNFRRSMDKREIRRFDIGGKYTDAWYRMTSFPSSEGITVWGTDITESKKAEENLRNSELQLRHAQKIAKFGSWELDIKTNNLIWSDEVYRIFGVGKNEFNSTYETFLTLIHPDDRNFVNNAYSRHIKKGIPYDIVHRLLLPNGNIKYVREICETFFDEKGKPVKSIGSVQDITSDKFTTEKLREQADLIQAAYDAIITIDKNNKILFWNKGAERLYGYTEKEALGKTAYQLLKTQFPVNRNSILTAIKENSFWEGELIHKAKKGYKIIVISKWILLKDSDNPVFLEVNRDITQRKKYELELEQSRQDALNQASKLQAVLDSTPAIIWIAQDRSGKNINGNKAAQEFLQVKADTNMSKSGNAPEVLSHYYLLKNGKILNPHEMPIQQVSMSGKPLWNYEMDIVFDERHMHSLVGNVIPIYDSKGKTSGAVGAFMDITERKHLERQKDEFVSIASHELKTPITSIKAFGQILRHRFIKTNDLNSVKLLDRMDIQVNKLVSLVSDLLDVTKIQTGKLAINKESFYLDEFVKEQIEDVQAAIESTGYHHKIIIKNNPHIKIYADKFRLGQVFSNLLSNASKYSPDKDKITISIEKTGNAIKVSVKDYGIGIPKDKINQLFQKFYQAHPILGEKDRFSSLGLGLYISSEIINKHHGKIWVKSKVGKGSTFFFCLPLK